ncbi:MAG: 2-isopropylmalate synthase, partial [Armatimonadetes bacterium]|nr:2-isopropylmalate synthase [Armatimonadota bacterium]
HQDGVLKERTTYEIIDPAEVGWKGSGLILGRRSGKHAFSERLKALGYTLSPADLEKAFERFKIIADKKKEVYDEDLEAIVADEVYAIPAKYHLVYMNVMTSLHGVPTATIKLKTDDQELTDAGIGVGSVDAVYRTIDKLVDAKYKLVDFVVKSVTGGTDALGEVTVKLEAEDGRVYTGRGASLDIVEASAKAYINAINKLVYYQSKRTPDTKTADKAVL